MLASGPNILVVSQEDGSVLVTSWCARWEGADAYEAGDLFEQTMIWRLGTDGRFDTKFGRGGSAIVPGLVRQLAVAPGGGFIGLTTTPDTSTNIYGMLVAYDAEGQPDRKFGDKGTIGLPLNAVAFALDPDGKIRLAGTQLDSGDPAKGGEFSKATCSKEGDCGRPERSAPQDRLPLGVPIPSSPPPPSTPRHPDGVAVSIVQPDGKRVVATSYAEEQRGMGFEVSRFLADGSLDRSVGDGGIVFTRLALADFAITVAIAAAGRDNQHAVARMGAAEESIDLVARVEDAT